MQDNKRGDPFRQSVRGRRYGHRQGYRSPGSRASVAAAQGTLRQHNRDVRRAGGDPRALSEKTFRHDRAARVGGRVQVGVQQRETRLPVRGTPPHPYSRRRAARG